MQFQHDQSLASVPAGMTALSGARQACNLPDFNPMALLSIFEPAQQVMVVDRQANASLTGYLQHISAKLGPGFRLTLRPEQASATGLDAQLKLPEAPGKMALLSDIGQLVQVYADLMDCPQVGLRLEVLTQAMCPKFHIDRTGIRLLCTYVGPGTEWLEEGFCNRAALTRTHASLDDFHQALILHPHGIHQASPQALVLLKGSRWQGNDHAGAIHRSPQITPGFTRVVLALDAIW